MKNLIYVTDHSSGIYLLAKAIRGLDGDEKKKSVAPKSKLSSKLSEVVSFGCHSSPSHSGDPVWIPEQSSKRQPAVNIPETSG